MEAARDIKDERTRCTALAAIAATQARAGSVTAAAETFAQALRLAETIKPLGTRNEALRGIAAKQAEAGLEDAAVATLDSAVGAALAIDYFEERFSVLMATGEELAKLGQTAKAAAAFEQVLVAATAVDRDAVIWSVARAQVNAELLKEAEASIQRALTLPLSSTGAFHSASPAQEAMQNQDADRLSRVGVLSAFAQEQIALRQDATASLETSLRLARAIQDPGWRAGALISVARPQAAALPRDAAAPLDEAVAALKEELEDLKASWNETARQEALDPIVLRFVNIACMQVKIGASDQASETLKQALVTTTQMTEAGARIRLRSAIAEAQAKHGRLREALQTAASIEFPTSQARALIAVAEYIPD
jgi:tetratricopeptide (TPR) repeat protein